VNASRARTSLQLVSALLLAAVLMIGGAWGQDQRVVGVPTSKNVRFAVYDVFVDPGAEGLAAYQVEIKDAANAARIVGIEGGEGVYKQAPYYDPAAMQHEHVIIGALSTSAAAELPKGLTRVARMHVMIEGGEPKWESVLMTAGAEGGRKIEGSMKVRAAE